MTRDITFLRTEHECVTFEIGEHPDEYDTIYSLSADALERSPALIARIKHLEKHLRWVADNAHISHRNNIVGVSLEGLGES